MATFDDSTYSEPPDPPRRDESPILSLEDITKSFGATTAVQDVSLSVYEGELLTLLGPSGCGKTTTLRVLAGLEVPSAGRVTLDGTPVASPEVFVSPEQRDVGLVFQDYALFPHLTVSENIAFGLQEQENETDRVDELLELVDLAGYEDRTPDQLSGGEQQRVALARSLAPEPSVLLLDEPFSNLDVRLRVEMREEVRRILKAAGVTAVSVTHDQEEALSISDRVAIMNNGQVVQAGRPEVVFQHPESRFVASFLGQASFLSARIDGQHLHTAIGKYRSELLEGLTAEYDGADVDVLVRPDDLRAEPVGAGDGNGQVVYRQYTGPTFVYRVELGNGDIVHCQHNHTDEIEIGQPVQVELVADHSLAWYPTR